MHASPDRALLQLSVQHHPPNRSDDQSGRKRSNLSLQRSLYYRELFFYSNSHNSTGQNISSEAKADEELVKDLLFNTTFVCITSLHKMMDSELSAKRTAVVTVAEDLEKHYGIFYAWARRSPRRRQFSHNNDGDDKFLTRPRAFAMSGGILQHQKLVKHRIQVLLSSGVYFLWEKWERFIAHRELSRLKSLRQLKPLSLGDVNVLATFYVLLGGLFLASLRFTFEKMTQVVNIMFYLAVSTVVQTVCSSVPIHGVQYWPLVMYNQGGQRISKYFYGAL